MRPISRLFVLAIAIALATPLSAAHAHPRLLKAAPAADSKTAEAPRQLALTFSESLDLALTRVTLHHGDSTLRLDALRLAADDDKTVVAALSTALAPGLYTVRWMVTGDDGHPVRGSFSFEVLAAPAPAARPSPR
jgi:methionine-rich copper-binding protein CopC